MKFTQPNTRIYIPDSTSQEDALSRTTHLGIGAHQDNLEFMAIHGIIQCFHTDKQWFTGVTCTNGAGSARAGRYANYTDEEMTSVRLEEQEQAARVGRYSAMLQLDFPSAAIVDPAKNDLANDLLQILKATRPQVVYCHNPADKHDTYLGVLSHTIRALRWLEPELRPRRIYGCEGWRGLDWLNSEDKIRLDVSGHDSITSALQGVFDSQISGGKRYDMAVEGRKMANATFYDAHTVDAGNKASYNIDLTPLVEDPTLDVKEFTLAHIDRFRQDVDKKLSRLL